MCNSDSEMLATIENLGLTIEQLGEAYRSDDYKNLQQVLNKLDKKTLVELTSKLAVYSMVTMIQMSNDLKMQLDKNNQLATIGQRGIENMSDMRDIEKNGEKIHKSKQAKRGGEAKRNNDPKQAAKADVKVFYVEWQSHGNPKSMYRSAAAFATAMMDKFNDPNNEKPTLESQTVITRWCTQWKKELNNTHPA